MEPFRGGGSAIPRHVGAPHRGALLRLVPDEAGGLHSHCGHPSVVVWCAMNSKRLCVLVASLGAAITASFASDEQVELQKLPPAVRETVMATNDFGPVKEVTRINVEGRNVYIVEFEQPNAINPRMRIAEDGSVIGGPNAGETPPERRAGTGARTGPSVGVPVGNSESQLQSLPEPVQKTVRAQADNRRIANFEEETSDGRTVYEIEFAEPGLNPQIQVAADGTLIRDEPPQGGVLSWFRGLQLADTPDAVQKTVKQAAGGRSIADVDRKERDDGTVYEIEVREEDGGRFELEVAANGGLVRDSRDERRSSPAE